MEELSFVDMKQMLLDICQEYSITEDEFISNRKYKPLTETRELFCFTCREMKISNNDIIIHTGFTRSKITNYVNGGERKIKLSPAFKRLHLALIKKYSDLLY